MYKWLCPKRLKCIKTKKKSQNISQHLSPTCIQPIYSVSLIIFRREANKKMNSKTLTWMVNPIEINVKIAMSKTLKMHIFEIKFT